MRHSCTLLPRSPPSLPDPLPPPPPPPAAQLLQGYRRDTWYIFERVAITKDLYTGGGRTFVHRSDAREFRQLIYAQYGECVHGQWTF